MGTEKIQIVATATDRASPTLRKLQSNVTALGSKGRGPLGGLLSGLGGISPVALVGAAGIGALTGALADDVAGALAEEKQMARLGAVLKANVKDWDGSTAAVNRATSAAMDKAFSDDDAREAMIKLLPVTRNVGKATRELALAMDLARFKDIGLADAAQLLVQVHAHQYRGLKQLGIALDSTATSAEALDAIQKIVAGQAGAYADTTAGKFEQAKVKVDDFLESLGRVAIEGGAAGLDALHGPSINVRRASPLYPEYYQPGGAGHAATLSGQQAFDDMMVQMMERKAVAGSAGHLTDPIAIFKARLAGFGQSVMPEAESVGQDIATALSNSISDNLVDSLKGNKGFVNSALKDMMWALNHPKALEKQLGRLQGALNSQRLQTLLTSDNPMQQLIGRQIRDRLTGQVEALTNTTYVNGVTSIVTAINGLRGYLTVGSRYAPSSGIKAFAKGGYIQPGKWGMTGEEGPEMVYGGRKGVTVTPNGGGRLPPIYLTLNGRVLGQYVDEYLGKQHSFAPTGAFSRG